MGKIDRNFPETARSLSCGLKANAAAGVKGWVVWPCLRRPRAPPATTSCRHSIFSTSSSRTCGYQRANSASLTPHVREVANSISTFGFCAPILVGKDNLVLDCAARVQVASAVRRVSGSHI
jgi:hypothetical protein